MPYTLLDLRLGQALPIFPNELIGQCSSYIREVCRVGQNSAVQADYRIEVLILLQAGQELGVLGEQPSSCLSEVMLGQNELILFQTCGFCGHSLCVTGVDE